LAGIVEGSDIAVTTAALAVGLGVVGIEVIAPGECAVAAWNPTNMGLLLGVALHVPLEMLLALETSLAARLLALELNLLDHSGEVFKAKVGANQLLFGGFSRRLAMSPHDAITVDRRHGILLLVFVSTR
jgi:hypothetical protein